MTKVTKKTEPVELIGWDEVAAKLGRSVRDAQAFVDRNPSFPLIRNGKGSPVRASIQRVEAWLEGYHLAFEAWNNEQGGRHPSRREKLHHFSYRPTEAPGVAAIRARGEPDD